MNFCGLALPLPDALDQAHAFCRVQFFQQPDCFILAARENFPDFLAGKVDENSVLLVPPAVPGG